MVNRTLRRSGLPALILVASLAAPLMGQYIEHDLVSDIPHLAPKTNSNVVNPWGIASTPSGPLWISDNGAGVSTVLMGNGNPFPDPNNPLVITIPLPGGGPGASPTGVVLNSSTDFVVSEGGHSGPAAFIFATEDGTISAWNPNVDVSHALLKVDNSTNAADGFHLGAVYKGIAIGHSGSGNFIYATNFRDGVVEMVRRCMMARFIL